MNFPFFMPEPGSLLDRIFTFVIANLLWLFCAVLIIPLPAATAGLFAVLLPWVRGTDKEVFATFFGTMRRQWLKSTVLLVADGLIVGFVVLNFRVLDLMDQQNPLVWLARSAQILVLMTVLMTNVYLWPMLVLFDLPLRRLIRVSFQLALGHSFWTLLVVGLAALPLLSAVILPGVIVLLLGGSATTLIMSWGAWRMIRRHATSEELAELDNLGT